MKLRGLPPQVPTAVRSLAAGAIAAGGALFLARWLGRSLPLRSWFVLDLATIWLWQLTLGAACASTGALVVHKLVPARDRTRLETIALAFPVGAVVFVLAMYVGGFLHLYGPTFAVVLPLLMIGAGGRQALAAWQGAREAGTLPRLTLARLPLVASVLGLLMLGVLYLGAIHPDAINYDASWVHVVIAQDYAREGKIVPFPGNFMLNVPHLGSVLNTWAFIVPGLDMPALRWIMALHTEFTVVVWTMVGIAAAARRLAAREAAATWTVYLLFPGLFVYDNNIGGAADHFAALFAAPLLLAAERALRRFDRGWCLLLGAFAGGAVLTKLQAGYLLVPIGLAGLVRAAVLIARRRRAQAVDDGAGHDDDAPSPRAIAIGIGAAAAAAFVVVLPHLASHAVFFHNPVYPFATDLFNGITDPRRQAGTVMADWAYRAPSALTERFTSSAKLSFSFSLVPQYYFVNAPVFGSVFTLALPLLLIIGRRNARRLWLGAFVAMGAVFMWAFTYRIDRNLQVFLPVLAAVTAAILVRAWELGRLARAGVGALVAVQLAWGAGLMFSGNERMNAALTLLRGAMEGRSRELLRASRADYVAIGNSLPPDAKVLLHDFHLSLGINRPIILDWLGYQDQIDYASFETPRALHDRLRALGVTHVVWVPGQREAPTRQEEILWGLFVETLRPKQDFGPFSVAALPTSPPAAEPPYQVMVVGMPGLDDGLYPIQALSNAPQLPPPLHFTARPSKTAPSPAALLDEARVVLAGASATLDATVSLRLDNEFRPVETRRDVRMLVRRR
jgi:hypothetical protein